MNIYIENEYDKEMKERLDYEKERGNHGKKS